MFRNLSPGAVGIPANLRQAVHYAQIGGFQGLDLYMGELRGIVEQDGVEAAKQVYADAGLRMGGWGLPVNWRGSDKEFYESLGRLPEQAKLAADLGCHRTMTWVAGWSNEKSRQEQFDFLVRRFRLVAEVLRDYGHSLGLEFIGPHTSRKNARYGCVYTMDAMLAIGCAIGTGNVGLLLDAWHWYTCQSTLADLRQLVAEEVVYVHICDAPAGVHVLEQMDGVRELPGATGVIDLVGFLQALRDIGYEGPVTPEPFNKRLNEMADKDAAARTIGDALMGVWKAAGLP
jgi:sugar phosphate isomerase/epimerase